MPRCVSIFRFEFHSLHVQKIEKRGGSFFVAKICQIGGSFAVESSLLELNILFTGALISHKRVVHVFKRQQYRLLVLSELKCAAGLSLAIPFIIANRHI